MSEIPGPANSDAPSMRGLLLTSAMLLDAPGSDLYVQGLQERIDYCSDYMVPLTLVGIFIEDMPIGTGSLFTPDLRMQLLSRARTLIQRSVRTTPNDRRKVTDAVFRLDPLFVTVLCNADRSSHLIPAGRIIEALRQASYVNELQGRSVFRRRIAVGSVTWDPSQGIIRPEELTAKMVEAVHAACETPSPEGYARLGIGQSQQDQVQFYPHPWGEKFKPLPVIERSGTQPVQAPVKAPAGSVSGRTGPIVRSASGPMQKSDPKKPFWRFW